MTMKIINDTNDTSDKSDTSDTANSSDASKTSAYVRRLSSYFKQSHSKFLYSPLRIFLLFQRIPFKLHILWAENFPFRQGG